LLAAGIAFIVALMIIWALFVPVADWLAHHDVGSVKEGYTRRHWIMREADC
jgi:hypothetical protein